MFVPYMQTNKDKKKQSKRLLLGVKGNAACIKIRYIG